MSFYIRKSGATGCLKAAKARGKVLGRKKLVNGNVIRELSQKGMSQRRIASLLNCSKTTVQREITIGGPKTLKEIA